VTPSVAAPGYTTPSDTLHIRLLNNRQNAVAKTEMIDVEYKELVLVSKEHSVNKIRIMYWYVSDVFSQVAEEYL